MNQGDLSFFVTGGTLRPDAPSYVERRADRELLEALLKGEYCYVLTARQMGKSSLMVRTAQKLRARQIEVVVLDLTAVGQNLTPEQWYNGLLLRLATQLRLEDELEEFWGGNPGISPVQRFFYALRRVLQSSRPGPLVVFVDELDVVRSLPFSTDEFFAAIRECYTRRTEEADFGRLTFCLLGVASPTDLIKDTRITPFNVGRRVELSDFTPEEAESLAPGLASGVVTEKDAARLLQRILHWTNGHPYLTQRMCQAIAAVNRNRQSRIRTRTAVDGVCDDLFFSNRARERDDNLIFVRERMLRNEEDRAALLDLYARVRSGRRVVDDESNRLVSLLRLAGIVRISDGILKVRNRIYERAFDHKWVQAHMPDAELRRQKAAYRRGIVRTGAVSLVVILAMMGLALYAFQQSQIARKSADTASKSAAEESKQRKRAEEAYARVADTLDEIDLNKAEVEFGNGDSMTAIAYLGRVLRRTPTHRIAVARLTDILCRRGFPVPVASLESDSPIRRMVFSPDGRLLAVVHADRTVRIWKSPLGVQIASLQHEHDIRAVQFSGDAERLLTITGEAGPGSVLHVWSTRTGKHLASISPPAGLAGRGPQITGMPPDKTDFEPVIFSADARRVFMTSASGSLEAWDADSGQIQEAFRPLERSVPVKASADGQLLLAGPPKTLLGYRYARTNFTVHDARSGKLIYALSQKIKDYDLPEPVFSADSRYLYNFMAGDGPGESELEIRSATNGTLVTKPLANRSNFDSEDPFALRRAARMRNPGQSVAENVINVLERNGVGPVDLTIPAAAGSQLDGAAWTVLSPDGIIFAVRISDTLVELWDVRSPTPIYARQDARGWLQPGKDRMDFSANGDRFALADYDGTVKIFDLHEGQVQAQRVIGEKMVQSIRLSPDGRRLVSVSQTNIQKVVKMWDASTGIQSGKTLTCEPTAMQVTVSPAGARLATLVDGKTIRTWDLETSQQTIAPMVHSNLVTLIEWSPDDRTLGAVSQDGSVQIWNSVTGQSIREAIHPGSSVSFLRFSPDGKFVAIGADKNVRVWGVQSGSSLPGTMRHDAMVRTAVFNDDNSSLVTVALDRTARIWDVPSGRPQSPPLKHAADIQGAIFIDHGRAVATSGAGAQVWDVPSGKRLTSDLRTGHLFFGTTLKFYGGLSGFAQVSPSGEAFVSGPTFIGGSEIMPLLLAPAPIPAWLSLWAEAASGRRINDQDGTELLPFSEFSKIKNEIVDLPDRGIYGRWAKWYLADRGLRSINPFSGVSVPEYTDRGYRPDALRISPTNVTALAERARASLANLRNMTAVDLANPDFRDSIRSGRLDAWMDIELALRISLAQPKTWQARAELWRELGNAEEALAAADQAGRLGVKDPDLWSLQGEMLEVQNQFEEAIRSFTKVIRFAEESGTNFAGLRDEALLRRMKVTRRLHRSDPFEKKYLEAKGIPPRDAGTRDNCIDLTFYYNAPLHEKWHVSAPSGLEPLLAGVQTLAETEFDVRGLIQLGETRLTGEAYSREVREIPVERTCKRLHFLHSAVSAFKSEYGREIGRYIIHFTDGEESTVPLVIGRDLADWWSPPAEPGSPLVTAWRGTNEVGLQNGGASICLFKTTWENPRPETAVRSIDFAAANNLYAKPFLVAITAE